MMHHWQNVAVWAPREEDVLWRWNRYDTSQIVSSSSLGNRDGEHAGTFAISSVPSPYSSDSLKDYVLKLEFTQSVGGMFYELAELTQSRYCVHLYFLSSAFYVTYQIVNKRFLSGMFDQATQNGIFFTFLQQSSGRGHMYYTSGSASLMSQFASSGFGANESIMTYFVNKKPEPLNYHYRVREKTQENQVITANYSSLSYSVPSQWSGSSMNKFGIAIMVTGSLQGNGVIYLKDIVITKHPFDIE